MDDRATEIRNPVLDLLTLLRLAIGQLRLYPAASPQAQKTITPAQAAIAAFPAMQGRISIARTMRGLLVNSKRLPAGDAAAMAEKAWLQVLHEAHVNSLVIQTAISVEELTGFLDALAKKFWELKDGKAINGRLRDERVLHAWVEEVEFVAMGKGDLLIEGAANKLEAAGARVTEIVATLEQVIDGSTSEGLAEQVRLEIMRKLLEQDPTLIQKAQAMAFALGEELPGEGSGTGGGGGDGGGGGTGTGGGTGDGVGPGSGSGGGSGGGGGTGTGGGTGDGVGPGSGTGSGGGSGSGGGTGTGTGTGGGGGSGTGLSGSGPRPGGRRTLFGTGRSPGWISFDQTRRSLAEIARLMQTADPEERESLRTLGHLLLGGFRYDPLLLALLKKFLEDEALDLMPAWMQEEEKKKENPEQTTEGPPPPVQKMTNILAADEEHRIESLWEEALALTKELIGLKRFDLIGEMIKHLVEHARHVNGNHRLKAVRLMLQIYPLMEAEELKDARAAVESRVQAAVAVERDKGIFPPFVELSVMCTENLLARGAMEQAAPILEALRKQAQTDDKEYVDRKPISARGVEKVAAGKGYPGILEKLRTKNPFAVRLIEAFGPTAARSLVERMKVSDSVAERMDLALLIFKAGPEAGEIMAEEVQQVRAPSEALKLLDLVPLSMAETQAETTLGASLRHPALAVRRKAATLLGGKGFPRGGSHLVEALRKEADPSARLLYVETLGNLRYEAALTTLGTILESRSETDDVRSSAASGLANIGKPQAIPMLTRASAKGRGFTLVLNAAPTSVRTAAVRALGSFGRYPEARDALRKSLEDPDVAVREVAREALVAAMVKVFGDLAKRAGFVSNAEQLSHFSEGGVAGYLSEVPLDQICQILEEGTRTGLLMLNVGGSNAKVYLDKGGVVAAEYNGLKGQDAFNLFCRWEGTYFMFTPGVAAPAPGLSRSLIKMMMDACELRDRNERPGSAK